ncbi:MAG: hypothetical protein Q8Q08_08600 [Candidatus Omnitrophota bacterium]|nr:hypothetical protein [Candidatus Omnitrophota bacterium]MDZ4241756.1 hypothetical protein [Candidatus Omnitrophota bacterium]
MPRPNLILAAAIAAAALVIGWFVAPQFLFDAESSYENIIGEWRGTFAVDKDVKNVEQTGEVALTFLPDKSCLLYIDSIREEQSTHVSRDGKSRSSSTGHYNSKRELDCHYHLQPAWFGPRLVLAIQARSYYTMSFEPFVVVRKPGRDIMRYPRFNGRVN